MSEKKSNPEMLPNYCQQHQAYGGKMEAILKEIDSGQLSPERLRELEEQLEQLSQDAEALECPECTRLMRQSFPGSLLEETREKLGVVLEYYEEDDLVGLPIFDWKV